MEGHEKSWKLHTIDDLHMGRDTGGTSGEENRDCRESHERIGLMKKEMVSI